ncbi:MAG: type IX secretion system membrane protein PorP/SprF [Bacteroidales bacterium]|nr:type IX secretion system membrane protein PorP/SprF [Bacteroidales bacterium]MBP5135575.1 PorP/SprF family type IX secretion system membrane protein [Paludibacteraceae bacterium]MBR6310343.1 PorP/SprF family type IX secretion system membrane protein [Paludibacteraceae bacterium]
MKKVISIVFISFFCSLGLLNAQKIWGNPMGQYVYNPAGASTNDIGEISVNYYRNYMSATNSPKVISLMGASPFANNTMGAGFRFCADNAGVLKNLTAEATFVYKVQIARSSRLSFGLSATYNQMALDKGLMNPQHPDDPILTAASDAGSWFDMNFGVSIYQTNKYYVGLAMYNLLSQRTNWLMEENLFVNRSARLASLCGMYTFDIHQGDFKIELSGVAQTYIPQEKYSFSAVSYDLSARFILKKMFWLGSGYSNDMAKLLAGFYIQRFTIGYAGGFSTGDLKNLTNTMPRHEIFLRVEFETSKASRKAKTE